MQSTFWDTFLRFSHSTKNKQRVESFLFRYFKGYDRVPARRDAKQRRAMIGDVDVEEVFTFLSERARAPSTSPQLRTEALRIWEALVSELPNVFGRFGPNVRTRAIYRKMVNNFIRARDTIVSFNYDTVFERSLPKSYRWHYEGIKDQSGSIGVLKPHGSINWEDRDPIRIRKHPARSLIVAPTHLKFVQPGRTDSSETRGYLDHSPNISAVWKRMEQEMREAKVLVFIGYSFPVADLYFSSILRSVLADRTGAPAVTIVNPDAVAIRERMKERFTLERIDVHFDLANFVGGRQSDWLRRIAEST